MDGRARVNRGPRCDRRSVTLFDLLCFVIVRSVLAGFKSSTPAVRCRRFIACSSRAVRSFFFPPHHVLQPAEPALLLKSCTTTASSRFGRCGPPQPLIDGSLRILAIRVLITDTGTPRQAFDSTSPPSALRGAKPHRGAGCPLSGSASPESIWSWVERRLGFYLMVSGTQVVTSASALERTFPRSPATVLVVINSARPTPRTVEGSWRRWRGHSIGSMHVVATPA